MISDFIVNRPRPKPPVGIRPQDWLYYWDDLACWKADKAEAIISGVIISK